MVLVSLCFSACVLLIKPFERNYYQFDSHLILIALLYALYALIVIVGPFTIHSHANTWMLVSYIIKILFLIYLLKRLTIKSLKMLFNIYSNLTVLLTVLCIVSAFGIYYGWFDVFQLSVIQGIDCCLWDFCIMVSWRSFRDVNHPVVAVY